MASIERTFTGRITTREQEQANALEARVAYLEKLYGLTAYMSGFNYSASAMPSGNNGTTQRVPVTVEIPTWAKVVLIYYEMEIDGGTRVDLYEPTDYPSKVAIGNHADPGGGFPGTWVVSGPATDANRPYGGWIPLFQWTPGTRTYSLYPTGFSTSREHRLIVDVM